MQTTGTTLKLLAGIVWLTGGVALLIKGGQLFWMAETVFPGRPWTLLAPLLALAFGGLKGRAVFEPACRRNLTRINHLRHPRIWQFFRGRFFVALFIMIAAGATLSRLVQGDYFGLIAVGSLDLSIAVSLFYSSRLFFAHPNR